MTTNSAAGITKAIAPAIARNFASRSPTTSSDRHRQLAEAVPERRHRPRPDAAQRRREPGRGVAQPVGVGRRDHLGGWPANSGCAPQWSAKASIVPLSMSRRRAPRPRPASRALGDVGDARRGADQDQPRHPARVREGDVQREPPAHASSRRASKRSGASAADVGDAGVEVDRPGIRAAPWPRRSGASASIAFAERARRPGPSSRPVCVNPWSRTIVRRHRHIMTAARHLPAPRAPSSTSSSAAACADACTSPGSRSTPLVLAAGARRRLRATSHIDERCAGFFALGLAKADRAARRARRAPRAPRRPNYAPAVIEAHEARVPLLVLTADRPPELREVGAGQTIDQVKLYGDARPSGSSRSATHEATPERLRWMRALACRAYWTALDGRPGPVHLNFPLREPLVPDGPLPSRRRPAAPAAARGSRARGAAGAGRRARRPDGQPRAPARACSSPGARSATRALGAALAAFAERGRLPAAGRPAVGRTPRPGRRRALRRRCCATSASPPATRPSSCCASATCRPPSRCAPGSPGCDAAAGRPSTPRAPGRTRRASSPRRSPPTRGRRCAALDDHGAGARRGWLDAWQRADARAAEAIADVPRHEELVRAARRRRARRARCPPTRRSSSRPRCRCATSRRSSPARDEPPRVLSNRGANGIDGTVSTAFGVAAAARRPGRRC